MGHPVGWEKCNFVPNNKWIVKLKFSGHSYFWFDIYKSGTYSVNLGNSNIDNIQETGNIYFFPHVLPNLFTSFPTKVGAFTRLFTPGFIHSVTDLPGRGMDKMRCSELNKIGKGMGVYTPPQLYPTSNF